MKHFFAMVAVTFLALVVLTTHCDAADSSSPSETVKAFYDAANRGKYDEARKYLSSEFLKALDGALGAKGGGTRGILDRATRDGTIEKVEVIKEEIRGDGAIVHMKLHLKGGNTELENPPLIKEKGAWKITIK
jgi:hypothetical protein